MTDYFYCLPSLRVNNLRTVDGLALTSFRHQSNICHIRAIKVIEVQKNTVFLIDQQPIPARYYKQFKAPSLGLDDRHSF